jgi:hypothetical protein
VFTAYRSATSETGTNVWNTALLIGWDEPGGTSLIATLRKTWGLGEALTGRDASARPFDHVFSRDTPRDPESWAPPKAHPVPEWTADPEVIGQALSSLGKGLVPAFIAMARQMGVPLPAELNDPDAALPPSRVVVVLRDISGHFFPLLAGGAKELR